MALHVDIQFALDEASAARVPDAGELSRWAQAAVAAAETLPAGEARMTLRLVEEAEITQLNRDYRHKTAPTNVLSFPFAPPPGVPAGECGGELGDVVICAPVVQREAIEQGKTADSHWAHMVVHGTLHLLGYDHLTEAEAARMEPLETRILAGLGYADPYR